MIVLSLNIDPLLYLSVTAIVGTQVTFFGLFALAFARLLHLRVALGFAEKLARLASREVAPTNGILLVEAGLACALSTRHLTGNRNRSAH
jgi:hypothetical protein